MEVAREFLQIEPQDLWVYNKLQLSRMLGYSAGPVGANVPREGDYIIRPAINFLGMGRNARKIHLTPHEDTSKFGLPGEFWCEYFYGDHISVDFYRKHPILVVKGVKNSKRVSSIEETKWKKWEKISKKVEFPKILEKVADKYPNINVEYIGGRIIEAHFRTNPDFVWGNEIAIPVYYDEKINPPLGYSFVSSPDYKRIGFYIK